MGKLSQRLLHLAELVSYPVLADIGTDHGYLPIYLLQTGRIPRAFAMDINKGPLLAAKEHCYACGLGDYITLRLSDGLERLEPREADSILIAGMGADVMLHILKAGEEVAFAAKELILQPQSNIQKVREYLYQKGCFIDREDMVFEDGKYYPMMRAAMGSHNKRKYTKEEWQIIYRYGECLLESGNDVLRQYLCWKIRQYETIQNTLKEKCRSETAEIRAKEVEMECFYAKKALEWTGQRRKGVV